MKLHKLIFFIFLLIFYSGRLFSAPVLFDLTLFEDNPGNASYSGIFTIDSADLAALPPTGLSFSSRITSIEIDISGILFDITPSLVFAGANDGIISGITNINNDGFLSSSHSNFSLFFRTSAGFPFDWVVSDNSGIVRGGAGSGSYLVSERVISEPAAIWLFSLGLIGFIRSNKSLKISSLSG
ncbi:hypothetical protein [methane-oxidizing endosymbiont of Gigantopelta aegis]|uniref:hypothetical protein n=1 Tax=methane-oxidizing endosymbiont of Gigantopelta aegis TaxID=2794938 RepID=UPI0018DB4AED|nr:hypothetical protein [methane-oxidizing endosymbiont of Gigantopelta aegis]